LGRDGKPLAASSLIHGPWTFFHISRETGIGCSNGDFTGLFTLDEFGMANFRFKPILSFRKFSSCADFLNFEGLLLHTP
jgi:hypothetical protein